MTEHAISARIEGESIAIETIIDDPDYKGLLNTSYIDADAAIRLGQGLVRLGRLARVEAVLSPRYRKESAEGRSLQVKTLPLAVHRDPHAEDQG